MDGKFCTHNDGDKEQEPVASPVASLKTQSKSFRAICTAQTTGMADEGIGATYSEQSVKLHKVGMEKPIDQHSLCEASGNDQKMETNCTPSQDSKFSGPLEDDPGEKRFKILIEVKYNIRTGKEYRISSEFKCNLQEYMVWKYIMNSPKQCDKCNIHFNSTEDNITLLPCSAITINSTVNNKEHVMQITQRVLDYAIYTLGEVLTVETVRIKNRNIKTVADELNERFGQEIACALAVKDQIYIVSPKSGKEIVMNLLYECMEDKDHVLKTQKVYLSKVILKFPSMIERCFDTENSGINYNLEETKDQLVCTVNGNGANVKEIVFKLRSVEAKLAHEDLMFSTRKMNGLEHLCVEEIINEYLKSSFPNCVFVRTDTQLRLYSPEASVLSDAAAFVGELVVEWKTPIPEKLRGSREDLVHHLKTKYDGKILVDLEDEYQLNIVGLKEGAKEACDELIDIFEGRKSLNATQTFCTEDNENVFKTQKVYLPKVISKFPSMIERCFDTGNTGIEYELEETEDRLVYTINGNGADVNEIVFKLQSVEAKLAHKDLNFSTRKKNSLKHLCVEEIINEHLNASFPNCVFVRTDTHLRLYSPEARVLSDAATFVGELIVQWSTEIQENLRDSKEDIVHHLNGKYEGNIFVDLQGEYQLNIVGLKEAVEEARDELIDIHEGRKSLNATESQLPELPHETTEVYEIRNANVLKYFEKPAFIKKIQDNFNVRATCVCDSYVFEITGWEGRVRRAKEYLHQIDMTVVFDCVDIEQNTAVSFFESNVGNDFVENTEREFDVYLEKQSIQTFSNDKTKVSKIKHKEYNLWSLSKDRSLYLEVLSIKEVTACVKIIPSTHCVKTGDPIVKGQYMVEMGLPVWSDGEHSEREELNKILSQIFNEIDAAKDNSVAISLKSEGKWTFDLLMQYIVEFSVKWLLECPNKKPSSVKLCTVKGDFFTTDEYIDTCVKTSIAALQSEDKLKVAVRKGQLDKMKADVLVNTAAANLDLTKGNVSAALLKTAGVDLQQECRELYPRGIKHDEIAVTNGYRTGSKKVFHMTLLPYSQTSMKNCILYLQKAMLRCLTTASDCRYTSIAFPVMGTGSLRYPVELIAPEMFGCVERFRQDYPNTTLKEIMFVIFYKDVELLQYFQKVEREREVNAAVLATTESHQIKIEIIGEKEKVKHAKEHLEAKVSSLLDDKNMHNTGDICRNSSTASEKIPDDTRDHEKHDSLVESKLNGTDGSKYQSDETEVMNQNGEMMETKENTIQLCPSPRRQYQRSFSWSTNAKNSRLYECGKCLVRVYEGDILNVPVECVVNAANEDLRHNGGIAHAIATAAGETFVRESEQLIRNKGRLPVTSVERTAPGNLSYQCVLHAIGPRWVDYKPMTKYNLKKCANDLKQTIVNCLQLADDGQITSIALPSISSGLFGVPKDMCAIQYAEAVKEYSRRKRMLREIHFVDKNHDMIDIIHKTFKAIITEGKGAPFNINIYIDLPIKDTASSVYFNKGKTTSKNTARDRPKHHQPKHETQMKDIYESGLNASYILERKKLKCFFPSYCAVEVYEGDIMRLPGVDAIVCSENREGDARGVIANLLLKEGGQNYSQMKRTQFSRSRQFGEVITIPGGTNRYKWVIHAIVSRKDHTIIPVIYRKIFKEATTRQFTSLAIPVMGTGAGGIDPVMSSDMMFNEWIHFCKRSKVKPLTLHVVINDATVVSLVKDVFKRHIDDINQACPKIGAKKVGAKPSASGLEVETSTKHAQELEKDKTVAAVDNQPTIDDDCVICMDNVTSPKKLRCGHMFCTECIEGYFRVKKVCPTCGKVCGVITGDQPKGTMEIQKRRACVAGYEKHKSIAITYRFQSGKQGPDHPRPGVNYKAIDRTAYLPDNREGREICAMLKVAFERRLIFTIGASRTTGQEGVITWNDIHHKTDIKPNTQFGYPDNTYLQRVREELGAKAVTKEDVDRSFIKQLERDHFQQTVY